MSIKYFTGCNNVVSGGKNQHTGTTTGQTTLGIPETEPVSGADGIDVKPNRTVDSATVAKYVRIRQKVFSKTGDTIGKGWENNVGCIGQKGGKVRASHLKGKYNLGHMMKWRKTLKKMFTDIGHTAHSGGIGERNMFTGKGDGHEGNKNGKADANDSPLYPMDQVK
jgi:hypothetical protein